MSIVVNTVNRIKQTQISNNIKQNSINERQPMEAISRPTCR